MFCVMPEYATDYWTPAPVCDISYPALAAGVPARKLYIYLFIYLFIEINSKGPLGGL